MRYLVLLLALLSAALFLTGCSSGAPYPVRTFGMGEKVQLGHLSYTIFETQWLTQLGEGSSQRVPQHRYFLVRMSAVNGGAAEVIVPTLSVVDDKGQSYPELSNGDSVPQWIGFLRQPKPAESVQGNAVFDAPPAHYKLRILDETETREALIDIPLSFGAETPEVPVPGAAK